MSVRQLKKATLNGNKWIFETRYINLMGKKKHYTSPSYKSKREAAEAERVFLLSLTDNINYNNLTFNDLYNKYIEYQKDKVKKSTLHSYYNRWNHLEDIKNIEVAKFSSQHYELWRKKIKALNVSDDYKNDIQKLLKILLNFAMKWYGLNLQSIYNKISNFNNPNALAKKEMLFFTYDEFKKFISVEDNILYKCAFELLYYCGLRRGELLGLTWNNVDFYKKEIHIVANVVADYENGGYMVTSPKTKSSIRTIPLTDLLIQHLKDLKEQNSKIYGFKENWYVLNYYKPLPFSLLRDRKNKICDLAGVKRIRLHDFRHSCASLLISKGANITLVARYLGHTKIDETLNTYSHFYKSDLCNLVSTLESLN